MPRINSFLCKRLRDKILKNFNKPMHGPRKRKGVFESPSKATHGVCCTVSCPLPLSPPSTIEEGFCFHFRRRKDRERGGGIRTSGPSVPINGKPFFLAQFLLLCFCRGQSTSEMWLTLAVGAEVSIPDLPFGAERRR